MSMDSSMIPSLRSTHPKKISKPPLLDSRFEPISRMKGGCSNVYIVREKETGSLFAMKTPRADKRYGTNLIFREIEVLNNLKHDGVVKLIDFDNKPEMLLEYLGTRCLFTANLTIEQSVNAIIKTAEILSDLHNRNVLHRDIKPSNIFLFRRQIKFVDFAFSRVGGVDDIQSRRAVGTLEFMAPEQLRRVIDDPRSDLYSLGMTLYYMVTRKYILETNSKKDFAKHLLNGADPIPPNVWNEDIGQNLNALILKSIEKDPKKRFQSAEQFKEALSNTVLEP